MSGSLKRVLVETKVADGNLPFINSTPPTHVYFNKNRPDSSFGGGIAVIINKGKFFSISELTVNTFEFLILKIIPRRNQKPVLYITIYRPPNQKAFLREFKTLIKQLNSDKIVLSGEFNLHIDDPTNKYAIDFVEFFRTTKSRT